MIRWRGARVQTLLKKEGLDLYVKGVRCKSTNTYAKENPLKTEGIYIASRQKTGRGRGDKPFFSRRGGLYMSMVLPRDLGRVKLNRYPLVAGLSVIYALRDFGVVGKIKWPNDIILEGKKLGGVLCESHHASQNIIVGIGINIKNNIDKIRDIAISLKDAGVKVKTSHLIAKIANYFLRLESYDFESFLEFYRKECLSIGKEFTARETGEKGIATSIDEEGYLLLDTGGKTIRLINPTT